jgi:aspartate racemase
MNISVSGLSRHLHESGVKMKKYKKKLGILGGMGPEATAALYLGIIRRCQQQLGARYNSDFPQIIINSAPVPDGQMWTGFRSSRVENFLRSNIKVLQHAGADFVAVPCNSAHYFMPIMRRAVQIPVLSIVEETAKQIMQQRLSKVLLLATTFTAINRVYDECFSSNGVELVKPERREQGFIENIIVRVESGMRLGDDRSRIRGIIRKHQKTDHVEGVVAGCTEIPLLLNQGDLRHPLFDTIDVLASACYELSTGKRRFADFCPVNRRISSR